MRGGRARDPHVDLGGAGGAHHPHNLGRGRTADDAVVDQDDALAGQRHPIGVVLQLHAEIADMIRGLDKRPADIVVADDAELEVEARFLGVADGRGHSAVGNRHHDVGRNTALARQLRADTL